VRTTQPSGIKPGKTTQNTGANGITQIKTK
jgi:hypothetical protein